MLGRGFFSSAVWAVAFGFFFLISFSGGANAAIALAGSGSISGMIKNASGEAIPGGKVYLLDDNIGYLATSNIDSNGRYIFEGLFEGDYYLVTDNGSNYVDMIYPNEVCGYACYGPNTNLFGPVSHLDDYYLFGEPVQVVGNAESSADFTLAKGVTFSGRVVDDLTGEPIPGITVNLKDDYQHNTLESAYTDAEGNFFFETDLPDGSYLLYTYNEQNYIDVASDGSGCDWNCSAMFADYPGVSFLYAEQGQDLLDINFRLRKGAVISGYVKDHADDTPVTGALVIVRNGAAREYVYTDSLGYYQTFQGLAAGEYSVVVRSSDYVSECIGEPHCSDTEKLTLSAQESRENVNFAMRRGGSIAGSVTKKDDGKPVSYRTLYIYSQAGERLDSTFIDSHGNYESDSNLESGSYIVCMQGIYGTPGYLDHCIGAVPDDCYWCYGSSEVSGDFISVTEGQVTRGVDLQLRLGGGISGNVTDRNTGEPIGNAYVWTYDSEGNSVAGMSVSDEGAFGRNSGLKNGTYYMMAGAVGYHNECFGGVRNCAPYLSPDPTLSKGNPVVVVEGQMTTDINFQLSKIDEGAPSVGGTVLGHVINGENGRSLSNVAVHFDSEVDWYHDDSDDRGRYLIRNVQAGIFPVDTNNYQGFINIKPASWGMQLPSLELDFSGLGEGEIVKNVNIELEKGARILGSILDEATGEQLDGWVAVFDINGNPVDYGVTGSVKDGEYVIESGLTAGNYYLRTINSENYIDEYYGGGSVIGAVPFESEIPFEVAVDQVGKDIRLDFELGKGIEITTHVYDQETGLPLENYMINVFDANGYWVYGMHSYRNELFTDGGLGEGEYYFFVSAVGYENVVNNVGPQSYEDYVCDAGWCRLNLEAIDVEPISVSAMGNKTVRFELARSSSTEQTSETSTGGGSGAIGNVFLLVLLLGYWRATKNIPRRNALIH